MVSSADKLADKLAKEGVARFSPQEVSCINIVFDLLGITQVSPTCLRGCSFCFCCWVFVALSFQ